MAEKHAVNVFNILLLSRTGQGKSKTGNKLLSTSADLEQSISIVRPDMPIKQRSERFASAGDTAIRDHEFSCSTGCAPLLPLTRRPSFESSIQRRSSFGGSFSFGPDKYFKVARPDDIHSCTENCTYLMNKEEMIGVLDTPGLGDSKEAQKINQSIDQMNLKLIRKILIHQALYHITFDCVLYFVPLRGAPSKVDAFILDELKVLKRLIGQEIFKSMIIIVLTRDELDEHTGELPQRYFDRTARVYREAFDAIGYEDLPLPPIIYIGAQDDNEIVREKVKSAFPNDHKPQPLQIKFRNDRCCKCSGRLICSGSTEKIQLVEYRKPNDTKEVVDHDKSWCHPLFVPKHTLTEKIFGTVKWFILGLNPASVIIEILSKEHSVDCITLLNTEEVCIKCGKQPGCGPCAQINKKIEGIKVHHSTEV